MSGPAVSSSSDEGKDTFGLPRAPFNAQPERSESPPPQRNIEMRQLLPIPEDEEAGRQRAAAEDITAAGELVRLNAKTKRMQRSYLMLLAGATVFLIAILIFSYVSYTTPASCTPANDYTALAELTLALMDTEVDPCEDFVRYSAGAYLDNVTLDADEVQTSLVFASARAAVKERLANIINSSWPYLRTLYESCRDERAITQRDYKPIAAALLRLSVAANATALLRTAAQLRLDLGLDLALLFGVGIETDPMNPGRQLVMLRQNGFRLPAQSYYTDSAFLDRYAAWMRTAFGAVDLALSSSAAQELVALEQRLADISMTPVEQADPWATYNPYPASQLDTLFTPCVAAYVQALGIGVGNTAPVNVVDVRYFTRLGSVLNSTSLSTLINYAQLALMSASYSLLGTRQQRIMLAYRQLFSDVESLSDRDSQCSSAVSNLLGPLLGHYYLQLHFDDVTREAATAMFEAIRTAYLDNLAKIDWMDESTLATAQDKYRRLELMLGGPEEWDDLDSMLRAVAAPPLGAQYFDNAVALLRAYDHAELAQLALPTDPSRWYMLPYEVNAYYAPDANRIVLPAGILQWPFFDAGAPDAFNYGSIGAVEAHELGHVYDPYGAQYDAAGKLTDWWSMAAKAAYQQRIACIVQQFSGYAIDATHHLNGELVVGEAIADLAGLERSYAAWMGKRKLDYAATADEDKRVKDSYAGLTSQQLFFVAFGQTWATKAREGFELELARTDPHPLPRFRVEGTLANMPAFADAFDCPKGSRYNPESKCSLNKK